MQREQDLFASGQRLRLAIGEGIEIDRRIGWPEWSCIRRSIDLDLVGNGARDPRQGRLRIRTDEEARGQKRCLAQERAQRAAATGEVGTDDELATARHRTTTAKTAAANAAGNQTRSPRLSDRCSPWASAWSSKPRVCSTGHLSRKRPVTIVMAVSHTVCTRTQLLARLRIDAPCVSRPQAISAVCARSIA